MAPEQRSPARLETQPQDHSVTEGRIMAVARSDDGSSNVTRKRLTRKPTEPPTPAAPAATAVAAAPPAPAEGRLPSAARLDDLYRLPMPKLFALAEREGLTEHVGMNRAQIIVAIV